MLHLYRHVILVLPIFLVSWDSLPAQSDEAQKSISHFNGTIAATNNGISVVPTFSLDKPALSFLLSAGKERFTFEPELRFALEGKPWSMIFWWRYRAVQEERFTLRLGAHPAMNFRTIPAFSNGKQKDVIESRRFLATEFVPNYKISEHLSVGIYYLTSIGFDDSNKYTHFLVFNTAFSNLFIGKDLLFDFFPNVYFLKLDELEGYYFSSTFRLKKKNFPFHLEALINQLLDSEILPDRKFVWNVSLVYSFNSNYSKLKDPPIGL